MVTLSTVSIIAMFTSLYSCALTVRAMKNGERSISLMIANAVLALINAALLSMH